MSDTYLSVTPADPDHVPAHDRRTATTLFLLEHCSPWGTEVQETPDLHFVGGGQNTEDLECPVCGQRTGGGVPFEALELIREHSDGGLEDLRFEVPCCSREVAVTDLEFHQPCAFARFSIGLMNPEVRWRDREPPAEIRAGVEQALGCPALFIWQHS